MSTKRISGIIIVIIGIILIGSSFYIRSQVESGREQISEAEKKVQTGKRLFSTNPITKELGKGITSSVEKKIKEGSAKADRYETLALWFLISGGVLIVVGGVVIFMGRKKK